MTPLLAPLQSTTTPASPNRATQTNAAADGETFARLLAPFSNGENRTPEDESPDQKAAFAVTEDQVVNDTEAATTSVEDIPAAPDRSSTDAAADLIVVPAAAQTKSMEPSNAVAGWRRQELPLLAKEAQPTVPSSGPLAFQALAADTRSSKPVSSSQGQSKQPITEPLPVPTGQANDTTTAKMGDLPGVSTGANATSKPNEPLTQNQPAGAQGQADRPKPGAQPSAATETDSRFAQSSAQGTPQTATQPSETQQSPGLSQNAIKGRDVAKTDPPTRPTLAGAEQGNTTSDARGDLPLDNETVDGQRQQTNDTLSRIGNSAPAAPRTNPEKTAQTIVSDNNDAVTPPTIKDGNGQDTLLAKSLSSQAGTSPTPANPTSSAQTVVQSGMESAGPRPLKSPTLTESGKITQTEKADLSRTVQQIPKTPQDAALTQTHALVAGEADVIKQASRQTGAVSGGQIEGGPPLERADPSFRFDSSSPMSDRAVASTSAQIPTTAADQARQIAQQLAATMPTTLPGTTEITLQPEELGRVRMTLTVQDGALALVIHADRPETSDLMRRHIDQLMQTYRQMGFDNLNFSFAGSEQGQVAQTIDQQLTDETDIPENDLMTPDSVNPLNTALQGRLDLRM